MIRVTSFGAPSKSGFYSERDRYIQLTQKMIPFEWKEIPLWRCPDKRPKELLPEEVQFLKNAHHFWLLDAGGKDLSSKQFYEWCFKSSERHLVIGPAVGFHPEFKERAKGMISLSALTFTHGLAQAMLAESVYRSACMLKNHPFVK